MSTLPKPYSGSKRKLVIAFDVGTTFSGISYSILDPGKVPEVRGVTQFPAQENVGGDCKIPTLLYYDAKGTVRAAGAEAKDEAIEEMADEEGWIKAGWFKLHLRPKTKATAHIAKKIPPLPRSKTAVDLLADYLRYLQQCVRNYIEERHASGTEIWRTLEPDADYVLSHPNGWEGPQQALMRRAAVSAGLVKDDAKGRARITFLTEGEASLHFCVHTELTTDAIKGGKGVVIVDAGGGTIDVSAYKMVEGGKYAEIAVPQCHVQGSIMVTARAEEFLKGHLKGSRFSNDVQHIAESFDRTTKPVFRSIQDWQFIKFGSPSDRDDALNIRRGQLKLPGTRVAEFFEPSITCISDAIDQQLDSAECDISSIFLVGGFSANSWLFKCLRDRYSKRNIDVCRPDPNRVNKAVADGSISFYLDHYVSARMAKFDYGIDARIPYNIDNKEHRPRLDASFLDILHERSILQYFTILSKGTLVDEVRQFRRPFIQQSLHKEDLNTITSEIMSYRGSIRNAKWHDQDPAMFQPLCTIKADTSSICRNLAPKRHPVRNIYIGVNTVVTYYEIDFEIVLTLGKTEMTAHIAWMENGVEKTGPAELVYDTDVLIPC
ncbi:hypothetical protein BJ165DRAFT_1527080 [Panaeolus papilionaceus]|nr:hypothetical protein BJ165DRAFT_1527080 [Panaeolus papilionaceus]